MRSTVRRVRDWFNCGLSIYCTGTDLNILFVWQVTLSERTSPSVTPSAQKWPNCWRRLRVRSSSFTPRSSAPSTNQHLRSSQSRCSRLFFCYFFICLTFTTYETQEWVGVSLKNVTSSCFLFMFRNPRQCRTFRNSSKNIPFLWWDTGNPAMMLNATPKDPWWLCITASTSALTTEKVSLIRMKHLKINISGIFFHFFFFIFFF